MRNGLNKVVDEIWIHILCSVTFFQISYRLWDNGEKCGGARVLRWQYGCALHAGLVRLQARNHTPPSVHAHTPTRVCTRPRAGAHAYTHTHNVTYCIFTAAMVTWTRLSLTLYVHCLSCLSATRICYKRATWFNIPVVHSTCTHMCKSVMVLQIWTGLATEESGFDFRKKKVILLSWVTSRSPVGPTRPFNGCRWFFLRGKYLSWRKAKLLSLFCVEPKNAWRYTSTIRDVFKMWWPIKHRNEKFYCTLFNYYSACISTF